MKKWAQLKVGEGDKRQNIVVYPIEARWSDGSLKVVWRRYSDFEILRNHLVAIYPHSIIPALPDKRMVGGLYKKSNERNEVDQLEKRRVRLERFLSILSRHALISADGIFYLFLQQDDEMWKQKVNSKKEGKVFQMINAVNQVLKVTHNSVSNTNAAATVVNEVYAAEEVRENLSGEEGEGDKGMPNNLRDLQEVLRSSVEHSTAISNQLTTFLKISSKLSQSEVQTGLLLQELGGLLSAWSVLERDDHLQAAGHFVDAISQDVESHVDDEEQVVDSLRSHLSDLHVLKEACKRSLEENERSGTACNSNLVGEVEAFEREREADMAAVLLRHAIVQAGKCRKASNSWRKVAESFASA